MVRFLYVMCACDIMEQDVVNSHIPQQKIYGVE